MRHISFPSMALLAALAPASAAIAKDEKVTTPTREPLPAAIVVTGVAPASPLTFITDTKLPRQPVPASDGADYLKTIPGFDAIRNGGTNGDPVLRGMFGSRVSIVTNDTVMHGACPVRMDNALSYVAPETFDRLIVIKGPQTVLWGPGGSAGTVRFERDASSERFRERDFRLHANALAGAFGRNDQLLDVVGGTEVGYARLSANRSEADDYEDGDGHKVPSSWEKRNADLALGWTPSENTVLELSAGRGDGEARYAGRDMDVPELERTSYALRFETAGLEGAFKALEATLFYNHADMVMDNYTLREPSPMSMMPMPMASNIDRRTTGGRIAATWELANVRAIAGADTQESRHREREAMGRGMYAQQPWQKDADLSNIGAFAELAWQLNARSRAVAGARIDRAEATDRHESIGGMVPMPNPTAGQTRRETLGSGFVRYEHDAAEHPLSWFAGLGRSERMPDYWELFSADMGPMGSVNAFAALDPERTTQLDIGFGYRTGSVHAWASAYAGRIDDFILFTYAMDGMMGLSSMVEQVDADVRGAEAGVELRLAPHWTLGGTLAYSWAENRTTGEALPQIPPLDARFNLAYDNGRWSAGALLRAVARQDRVALGQGNVVGRDLGPTSGFSVFSMNAAYRVTNQVSIALGVDNLFDRTYAEHLNLAGSADFGYPADPVRINEPGRTAWLKLIWNVAQR